MSVCHGGNSDDLVSISAMTGTVAVNFCVYFNGLYKKKKKKNYSTVGLSQNLKKLSKLQPIL